MRRSRLLSLVLTGLALTIPVAACGGGDEEAASGGHPMGHTGPTSTTSSGSSRAATGNGIDLAFAQMMIPHHESAIDMAKIAQEQGDSEFVKGLADAIITAQTTEITLFKQAINDYQAEGVKPGDLGVSEHEAGMSADLDELRDADPFDRTFIDMMVPHHRGAITMANVEIKNGKDPTLKQVAEDIITAQQDEIDQMNDFRKKKFGGEVDGGDAGHSG